MADSSAPLDITWEEPACALCGGREGRAVATTGDLELDIDLPFTVKQCAGCGLAYTCPRPSMDSLLRHFYPESYTCYKPNLADVSRNPIAQRVEAARRTVQGWLRARGYLAHVPASPSIRFLDVGSSYGELLGHLQRFTTWSLHGVEPNAEMAKAARARGFEVEVALLHETKHPDGFFQIVNFTHVFEHLDDPMATLQVTKRLLSPGGRIFIEIPNFKALERSIFGQSWWGYHLPRHLYHFTPETLGALLEKAGFSAVTWKPLPTPSVWGWSVQYALRRWKGAAQAVFSQNNPLVPLFFLPIDLMAVLLRRSTTFQIVAVR